MIIYPVVYPSALQFWLNINYDSGYYLQRNPQRSALPRNYQLSTVRRVAETLSQMYCLSSPIRLLSPNISSRIYQEEITCSASASSIPENCFVRIDDLPGGIPVYVACPEYCFLKAASDLTFYELILLGYKLCARYVSDDQSQFRQKSRTPITDTSRIRSFLSQCTGAYGIKLAKKAISHVLDNSNSPMESIFTIPAVLPYYWGGFGFPNPELNKDIYLSAKGQDLLGYEKCCCDLVWTMEKVICEYDSVLTHMETKQFMKDKKRASALSLSGYKVFHITYDYMNNFQSFEKNYAALRCALGIKNNRQKLEKYREKRYDLFRFLLRQ